jgi:hypothetical protein
MPPARAGLRADGANSNNSRSKKDMVRPRQNVAAVHLEANQSMLGATMLRPKASAIASSLIAVAPVAIPPTTIVPHPINTKANVPMNSAIAFFIVSPQYSSSDQSPFYSIRAAKEEQLLRRGDKLPAEGRVLVCDMVVSDEAGPTPAKMLDIEMLVMTVGGKERTKDEFAELFASSGLRLSRIVPTERPICVIEAVADEI